MYIKKTKKQKMLDATQPDEERYLHCYKWRRDLKLYPNKISVYYAVARCLFSGLASGILT